jgi:hypothetical protein
MPSEMEPAMSIPGGWSRKVATLVLTLTATGLVGIPVAFVGFFVTSGPMGGCALGGTAFFLVAFIALLMLIFVALVGALASFGSFFLWRRSRWGPLLMIPSNFLTMAGFIYLPVHEGQVVWTTVVVLFATAPACAVGLLLWALWTRARGTERVIEVIVLGLIGLPLVALWVAGVNSDVTTSLKPPPQAAAPGTC